MEFLAILVLAGFVWHLWRRVDRLEQALNWREDAVESARPAPEPASVARPATRSDPEPAIVSPPAPPSQPEPEPIDAVPVPDTLPEELLPEQEPKPAFALDFEDIFGRRLPIWGGGIALAIAGIFLVRYSIESGLLTPNVRVAMSFLFGFGLIGAAEAAYRFDLRIEDERVRQALAGAGLATLFGAFYLAGSGYGLIGAGAAFLGLAAVTAAAIALSFRFGLPCAVLGLVGGFAAPVLVESNQANVPLLTLYLALVTGGLTWAGRVQGRAWLGHVALALGLLWGFALLLSGMADTAQILALGGYLVVLGTVLPAFLGRKGGWSVPQLAAGAVATVQMAALVADAGFQPLTWGLYLLVSAALAVLGWRDAALRPGVAVAAGVGIGLLALWPEPDPVRFALVGGAMTAVFAGPALAREFSARAGLLDRVMVALFALLVAGVAFWQFGSLADRPFPVLAAAMSGLALLPLAGLATMWRRAESFEPFSAAMQAASAFVLTGTALLLVTPGWLAPVMILLPLAGLLWLAFARPSIELGATAWAGAFAVLLGLLVTPHAADEFPRLWLGATGGADLHACFRWSAVLAAFAALARLRASGRATPVAEALAVAAGYGLAAQALPQDTLAWLCALAAVTLASWQPGRIAAWGTALVLAAAWALLPVLGWLQGGVLALAGMPMLVDAAIGVREGLLRVAPLAAVLAHAVWRHPGLGQRPRQAILAGLAATLTVLVHSLYKHLWGIGDLEHFVARGMAERSVWQLALVGAAIAAWRLAPRPIAHRLAAAFAAAGLAHFGLFTLLLHNPLWAEQAVGPWPIFNLLSLGYGTALAGLALLRRLLPADFGGLRPVLDGVSMVLIGLLALSLLRHLFAGSVIDSVPLGEGEDLLRSLLGIVLALGFLWWGGRTGQRSWRIGSLVVMLLAVAKVFLVDAAGLTGLLRVASFMALGFSLIAIGWFYARQLKAGAPQ